MNASDDRLLPERRQALGAENVLVRISADVLR